MAVCDIFQMLFSYTETLHVHKPIFLGTTLTYLLTPWTRVLLEKLTGLQLVKKFPTFYGT